MPTKALGAEPGNYLHAGRAQGSNRNVGTRGLLQCTKDRRGCWREGCRCEGATLVSQQLVTFRESAEEQAVSTHSGFRTGSRRQFGDLPNSTVTDGDRELHKITRKNGGSYTGGYCEREGPTVLRYSERGGRSYVFVACLVVSHPGRLAVIGPSQLGGPRSSHVPTRAAPVRAAATVLAAPANSNPSVELGPPGTARRLAALQRRIPSNCVRSAGVERHRSGPRHFACRRLSGPAAEADIRRLPLRIGRLDH